MPKKILIIIILVIFLIQGCARTKTSSDKIIAKVNGDPIYSNDVKRELALKTKSDPVFRITPHTLENEIDNIINKRLLIQQAKKLKLDQTERFVDTIKTFWEQTLIRDLIAAKNNEFKDKTSISDKEISDYYTKLQEKVVFKIIKRKDKATLEKMLKVEKDLIAWEETIGPVGYEEINLNLLQKAFDLPAGQAKIFKDRQVYYLVCVSERHSVPAPPLKEISDTIKKQIKERKQSQAISTWLSDIKSKSRIEIDKKLLESFAVKEDADN